MSLADEAILIGLGANLPSPFGAPQQTCEAALTALEGQGARLLRRSRWYRSRPVPPADQPWFVNGVALVAATLSPDGLLRLLHGIEARFGRRRRHSSEARTIDLDLLAYGALLRSEAPVLPHPRMHERAFVLMPLRDVAPEQVTSIPDDGEGVNETPLALQLP